jgi:hypothetical protein
MQIATTRTPSSRISNRNTTAFKIRRNHHKTQHITFSNRNNNPTVAINFPSAAQSSLLSLRALSTPYTSRSRNQSNSMKTNAGPDFYPRHLDPLRTTNSPVNPQLEPKFGALPNLPPISNRQRLRRLETMPNPLKTKARHDF